MTMSQKMIGQRLMHGIYSKIGAAVNPRPTQNTENKRLIKIVSLKNLIANGTVPISFSSRMAEGV